MGPGPPPRKAHRDGKRKPGSGRQPKSGIGSSPDTGTSSVDIMIGVESIEQTRDSSEGWNRKRYQREDEILWGLEKQTADTSRKDNPPIDYSYARNPAVNDLHPPVVSSQPKDPSKTQWMLQPPPKARVMAGKERADTPNRSRSGSGGSHGTRGAGRKGSDISLGRQVGERLLESKLKRGDLPSATESSLAISRGSSKRSAKSVNQSQPHDRDPSSPANTSLELPKRNAPTPPTTISTDLPLPSPPPPPRPPLSTIQSASLVQKPKDKASHLRPLLLSANSASSLRVLQELVSPGSQLNTIMSTSAPLPDSAIDVRLPPGNEREDEELQLPEVDSWFPERAWDFPRGKRRDLGQRWSMDV